MNTVEAVNTDLDGAAAACEDYSVQFSRIGRTITDSHGTGLFEYANGLKPRYRQVWRDITLLYITITVIFTMLAIAEIKEPVLAWGGGPFVAVMGGAIIAALSNFLHEGAHYNLAADRKLNDIVTNLFIGLPIGQEISRYRPVHFSHHRRLGNVDDPERSYFNAPTTKFILRCLFGAHVLGILRDRFLYTTNSEPNRRAISVLVPISILAHLGMIATLLSNGLWATTIAWIAAWFLLFPMLGSLRQLLEHRSPNADPKTDFTTIPHGALSRMFGDSLVDRLMGAAGFNRHLLHHWLPQVSYTRLDELDTFLADTPLAPVVQGRRTSYLATFRELFLSGRSMP